MIISVLCYLITFIIVLCLKKNKIKFHPFPNLNFLKNGILFYSTKTHRFKLNNANLLLVGDNLYIKFDNRLVIMNNVFNVRTFKNFVYFSAKGKVEIVFRNNYFRYFSINIKSSQFDFKTIKQKAIINLINNGFDLNKASYAIRFINFIKKTLNIDVSNSKIQIKPNPLKLKYQITYKLNNKIKKVNVN